MPCQTNIYTDDSESTVSNVSCLHILEVSVTAVTGGRSMFLANRGATLKPKERKSCQI